MTYLETRNSIFANIDKEHIEPFLLARGYFTEIDILPGYINPLSLDNIALTPLDWSKQIPRTSSIDILIEKPDKGLRKFSLLHPFIYLHLVSEITSSLEVIKERLLRGTSVRVYTIPSLLGHEASNEAWKHFSRIDPAKYFLSYGTVAIADIYNFYGSIYTHSISWAIHGRDEAKNKARDFTLLGNRLDKLFQNAQDGQTNGIPVGNVISDLAAELILKDIDELLSPTLEELNIEAFRYKDDYRFICKNKKDARVILDKLAISLSINYGLTLNQPKTKIVTTDEYTSSLIKKSVDVVSLPSGFSESSVKFSGAQFYEYLQMLKRSSLKPFGKDDFDEGIKKVTDTLRNTASGVIVISDDLDEWVDIIFVSFMDAVDLGMATSGYVYLLLDFLFSEIRDGSIKNNLVDSLIIHTTGSANVTRKLWTYAILLNHDSVKANSYAVSQESPLFKIASTTDNKHISVFAPRDTISAPDMLAMDNFRLINFDLFGRISGNTKIFTILEDDIYESLSSSHYDD
jgi:hypothetical protein